MLSRQVTCLRYLLMLKCYDRFLFFHSKLLSGSQNSWTSLVSTEALLSRLVLLFLHNNEAEVALEPLC